VFAARIVWLVDPFGFVNVWGTLVRTVLLRLPQSLLYMATLFLIAMWRRVVSAAERLHRIRSPVLVGRYKFILGALSVVLLGNAVFGALADLSAIEAGLVQDIVRGIYGVFAVGFFLWGSLYATQFLDVLGGMDREEGWEGTRNVGVCSFCCVWFRGGGLCCLCAESPERMAGLCALCQCCFADPGVDDALEGEGHPKTSHDEDVLDDALYAGCCAWLCARCCGAWLWGGSWGASRDARNPRRLDSIRVGPGTQVLTARRPLNVGAPIGEVITQVEREAELSVRTGDASASGGAAGGSPRPRRKVGGSRAQQEARARLRTTVTILLVAGLAYFGMILWAWLQQNLDPVEYLVSVWATQVMEQLASAAIIYALFVTRGKRKRGEGALKEVWESDAVAWKLAPSQRLRYPSCCSCCCGGYVPKSMSCLVRCACAPCYACSPSPPVVLEPDEVRRNASARKEIIAQQQEELDACKAARLSRGTSNPLPADAAVHEPRLHEPRLHEPRLPRPPSWSRAGSDASAVVSALARSSSAPSLGASEPAPDSKVTPPPTDTEPSPPPPVADLDLPDDFVRWLTVEWPRGQKASAAESPPADADNDDYDDEFEVAALETSGATRATAEQELASLWEPASASAEAARDRLNRFVSVTASAPLVSASAQALRRP
jgi:hypothetical protein